MDMTKKTSSNNNTSLKVIELGQAAKQLHMEIREHQLQNFLYFQTNALTAPENCNRLAIFAE